MSLTVELIHSLSYINPLKDQEAVWLGLLVYQLNLSPVSQSAVGFYYLSNLGSCKSKTSAAIWAKRMESFLILKFLNSYLNQIGAVMSTHLELHPPLTSRGVRPDGAFALSPLENLKASAADFCCLMDTYRHRRSSWRDLWKSAEMLRLTNLHGKASMVHGRACW